MTTEPAEDWPEPLPDGFDIDAAFARAERIGAAIYHHDMLAWWGSDALFADPNFPRDVRMRGWAVDVQDDTKIHFFVMSDDGPKRVGTVKCDASGPKSCVVKLTLPPVTPAPEQLTILQASRTAYECPDFVRKTERYNQVVMPARPYGHGDGWLVYLLAATPDPDVMMLGGHYRFVISPDGTTVREVSELTKSLLAMRRREDAVAAAVTHIQDPVPIETHVWASLMYKQTIYVATSTGSYEVAGGKIEAK